MNVEHLTNGLAAEIAARNKNRVEQMVLALTRTYHNPSDIYPDEIVTKAIAIVNEIDKRT